MSISLKFKGKTYRKLFSNLEPPHQQAELVVHGRLQNLEGKKKSQKRCLLSFNLSSVSLNVLR